MQDADGEVLETLPVPPLSREEVTAAIAGFLGDQYQTPPMYSAVKIDGVPLYKSARKGQEIEREPRFIRVMSWELTGLALPRLGASMVPRQSGAPHRQRYCFFNVGVMRSSMISP